MGLRSRSVRARAWNRTVLALGAAVGAVLAVLAGVALGWPAALLTCVATVVGVAAGWWSGRSERVETEDRLRASLNRFHALVANSLDVLLLCDVHGRVAFASPAVGPSLGVAPDDLFGVDLGSLVHPSDAEEAEEIFDRVRSTPGGAASIEVRVLRADLRYIDVEVRLQNLLDDPDVGGVVVHARDISDRRSVEREHEALEARLQHQADHDELSGLPNRKPLIGFLEMVLANDHRHRGRVAALFIDLDRFKVVNDSLGHQAGDRLLADFSRRLAGCIRVGDRAGRFGGDEFVVICPGIADADEAVGLADRVRRALSGRYHLTGVRAPTIDLRDSAVPTPGVVPGADLPGDGDGRWTDVFVTVSIGVALATGGERPEELLRDADAAMYSAKLRGRDRVQLFDGAMRRTVVERLDVEQALRRAIANDELRLYYQPVVEVPGGMVRGAEALVRWEHPERGLLLPGHFLAIAEETGLIVDVGAWVLQHACTEAAGWRHDHRTGRGLPVYINLSARQLVDSELVPMVAGVLADTGIEPGAVHFEITENALMADAAVTTSTLHDLRALGVRLALDDFGTGYSSLSYLKHFPVDVLKIDRAFVEGLGDDEGDAAITAAIVDVAQRLGLQTVAEGVERVDQVEWLAALGCDFAQGYHYARPMPAHDLRALLG